jgi:2-dehydropantoate 2-reductase
VVTFVDADADKVTWGWRHGVRVDQNPPLHADFQTFEDWNPPPGCTVLLCTKCYDNDAVLARLSAGVMLVPIQNGFDPALEAHGIAFEGIASFVSECDPHQTHTRITRNGRLHLGTQALHTPAPSFIAHLAGLLRRHASFRVEVVPDILPFKYTKLMYNAAISPLAAAAGLDNGQLLAVKPARKLFFDLLRENYTILVDRCVGLAKIGPFHPHTVARILRRGYVAHALAWAFYPTLRRTYCSMSRDLRLGRTEIDYYNRHLIELAGSRPCPLNRRVYALVKRMERERIPPGLERLDEL